MPHSKQSSIDILIVDDDRDLLTVYLEILISEGVKVRGAASGEEVLELLPQIGPPKIVLVDFMMPGLNGKNLFELLNSKIKGEIGRVFAFSALDRDCDLLNEVAPFVSGFIEKPSDLMDFVGLVKDLLAGKPNRHIRPSS